MKFDTQLLKQITIGEDMKKLSIFSLGLFVGMSIIFAGIKVLPTEKKIENIQPINIVFELPNLQSDIIDFEQLECLAKNIYFEARGESIEGQIAVSQVVLNRVNSNYFPNNICDVVYQGPVSEWFLTEKNKVVPLLHRCQFSWWCDGRSDEPRDMWAWGRAMSVAAAVMRGEIEDNTHGAMWYHATSVSPSWGLVNIANIGNHVFYVDYTP